MLKIGIYSSLPTMSTSATAQPAFSKVKSTRHSKSNRDYIITASGENIGADARGDAN